MQNSGSSSLNNDEVSPFGNINKGIYLADNSEYGHSVGASLAIKSGPKESEDNVFPLKAGISECLESVKDNVNVGEACINTNNPFKIKYIDRRSRLLRCHDCGDVFYGKSELKRHWYKKHKVFFEQNNVEGMRSTGNVSLDKEQLFLSGNSNVYKSFGSVGGMNIEGNDGINTYLAMGKGGLYAGASEANIAKCFGTDKKNVDVKKDCINKEKTKVFYVCPYCKKSYSKSYSLARHKREKHGEEGRYICVECGMRFFRKYSMNIHMDLKHNNKQWDYKCSECTKGFHSCGGIGKHMVKVHGWTLKQCHTDIMKKNVNASLNKDEISIFGNIKFDEYVDSVGGVDIGKGDMGNYLFPSMDEGCNNLEELDKNVLSCEDDTSKCLEHSNNVAQDLADENDTNGRRMCCDGGKKCSSDLRL